ncbi:DUF5677 domain-containing protein [Paraburkholderia antibiotica]|uniref:Uncharacterized protein n=1 Tax=Paraburkholderia antibiotica TaxID=2728839 RepID=A0A7X9ZY51_9BURK|nr:DUF5677 domain-containing protein [Paraburkholderia antibiotica]NML32767.1 hypothetical protein [Paraburkholderia antibiotica]
MTKQNNSNNFRIAKRNFEKDLKKVANLRILYSTTKKLLDDNFDQCIGTLKSSLAQTQCYTIISAIEEMVETTLICLSDQRFTTAEVLSRVILEHSVNLIYIISENPKYRARSFLRAHFENAHSRAKKWHEYAISQKNKNAIDDAAARMEYLQRIKKVVGGINNAEAWPDARRRFQSIGAEHFYHDVFAPASDSIHTLGEDSFNNWISGPMNKEYDHDLALAVVHAEKGSYAVYMSTNALAFYAEIVRNLIENSGNDQALQCALHLADSFSKLISDFTTLHTATIDNDDKLANQT